MLESLAKCYLADLRYPSQNFFQEKLELLENERKKDSVLMKELGRQLKVGDRFVALWGKLSQDWVHTEGAVEEIVGVITGKSDVPAWALTIPMSYTETELTTIEELKVRISQFRSLLQLAMEDYARMGVICGGL